MAKRITNIQKKELLQEFSKGKDLEYLSEKFKFSRLTISRHLKKLIGESEYQQILNNDKLDKNKLDKNKLDKNNPVSEKQLNKEKIDSNHKTGNDEVVNNLLDNSFSDQDEFFATPFLEIAPTEHNIDNIPQKDLSSQPIEKANLPKTVYMVVDNSIELEIKLLKDFPEWQFLSENDLNRKTIQIHYDVKNAKRSCSKNQKVIKVPNSEVFRITAPILLAKGISRIVSSDLLISL